MPQRKRHLKIFSKNSKKRRVFLFLEILVVFFLLFLGGVSFLFIYYAKDLPRPEKFTERPFIQSTKIYDRTGEVLLYDIYGEEKRRLVSLSVVPEHLKQAVIATEDASFYHHIGIDPKGVFRALLADLRLRQPAYGGSTITQQLIRSSFLTRQKTVERKVREVILTLELERKYSKDRILEFYLNQIPFGANSYGVETASQTYFNKSVSEISLPEAAILASLIKSPSYLSPYGDHKEELLARKDYVLRRIQQEGYITKGELEEAKKKEIAFSKILQPIKAPHFVIYVKDYLEKKYGEDFLKEKGLKVYTSLDWNLQEFAEKTIKERAKNNRGYNAFNSSLVAIAPQNGEILAMVGSADYFGDVYPPGCIPGKSCLFEPYPNVALRGRQPGSAFKPFVYATAFRKGYNDKEIVVDEETSFGTLDYPYIPQNYDGKFRGPVTLREALAQSLNVPSVKVLRDFAGLPDSIQTAKTFGITTLTQSPYFYGLPLVLGGGEVRLLEIVSAYGVFATEGFYTSPVFILKITDAEGNIVEENKKTPKRVLEPDPARLITDILSDNKARSPIFGEHSVLHFRDYQVAAKTGTTQDFKDGWVIGYIPSIVVGVWVGNNDNTPMQKEPGIVLAGPTWRAVLEKFLTTHH